MLIQVFLVALALNLMWEFTHWRLYPTAINLSVKKRRLLLLRVSFFDAVWITIFVAMLNVFFPVLSLLWVLLFVLATLTYAVVVETHALRTGRWEYGERMPTVCGIGLSPLVQLAITGLLTVLITVLL